ncbi:hypothetical protein CCACVL1_29507 [Corchorus capsularis]|uniref:Uncharacterized protein n=1 Tax=Corchorus capsularis TaxID=210143 RepID=A0A1R3G1G9_COCAP|nr:hypothetical protein CCACVL1_29507 [Corchorus capsularis]
MNHNFHRPEPTWTKSSESDSDDNANQAETQAIVNAYRPRAWRGPILQAYEAEITDSRILWGHCILAYMFDIWVFPVSYLQSLVRREWRSTGAIQVIGHQGAFFTVDWWRTNSVLRHILPDRVPVWLQLLDLPLEYQVPSIAQRMASLAGEVIEVDWMNIIRRNIRFMRMRKIERRIGLPIFYDTQEVHFTNNIMAFHRRVKRHTTRMTFSRMNDGDQKDSDDFDRSQQFRHHKFSPLPFEVPYAPTRSTILAEEHCEWRDLVTGRNLLPMDFGLLNPDIAEMAPDLNVPVALLPTDRTGTLQDIITVHARPVPPTLDEWLLCREQLDANNPTLLKSTAPDDINGSFSFSQVLQTTGVTQQPQPTTAFSPQPEPLHHIDQTLTPHLLLNTEPLPTSSQPLPITPPPPPPPHLETSVPTRSTQPLSTETTPSIIQPNQVDTSDNTKSPPKEANLPCLGTKRKRSSSQDGSSRDAQSKSEESASKKLLTEQFISLDVKDDASTSQIEEHDLALGLRQAVPQ